MVISKTDNKDTQKAYNKKFILALLIYAITVTAFDYLAHYLAPAHQNNEKQGQTYHTGELRMLDRPTQSNEQIEPSLIEPSRGEAVRGQEMVVEATSYSHTGNRTFSGTWPLEGKTIAVDGKVIEIGSRVYIQGVNGEGTGSWYLAEDKIPPESVKKGAIIDIFRNDIGDCWQWGRRDVRIKVIPPQNQAPQK